MILLVVSLSHDECLAYLVCCVKNHDCIAWNMFNFQCCWISRLLFFRDLTQHVSIVGAISNLHTLISVPGLCHIDISETPDNIGYLRIF